VFAGRRLTLARVSAQVLDLLHDPHTGFISADYTAALHEAVRAPC
jgi:hypothetical protein